MSDPTAASSRPRFLETAEALARQIREQHVLAKDDSVTWLGPRRRSPAQPYQMVPVGPQLYGGVAGIAIFLAAAGRVLDDGDCRELGLQAVAPLRRLLSGLVAEPERAGPGLGVGGFNGLGSLTYSLLRVGGWLEEPELIREAHAVTTLITRERIANDRTLDLMSGSTGLVLAMLALDRAPPESNDRGVTPLEIAAAAADHLLSQRVSYDGQPRAWVTSAGKPPLTGFSHGAAGVCYALLRLYDRTRDPDLLEAAHEGLAYERSHFVAKAQNWRDLRHSQFFFGVSWCHGAPGIGLGRVAALDVLDDAEARRDVTIAMNRTRSLPPSALDHLCCGNAGRAEILLTAAQKLDDEELLEAAAAMTRDFLQRAETEGHFGWLPAEEEPRFDPALLSGASGVGYALLRLTDPSSLPCLLLME